MDQTAHIQEMLFPVDGDEALLWERCERYKRLPEPAQRLVRSYISAHRDNPNPTRADWITASGLARSTGYEVLAAHGVDVYAAIAEAMQLVGKHGAIRGGLALVVAGALIYDALVHGNRSTRDLTSVELGVMRDCAAASGLLARLGAVAVAEVTDPATGRRVRAAAGAGPAGGDDGDLAELLALVEGQRRTVAGAAPHLQPEAVWRAAAGGGEPAAADPGQAGAAMPALGAGETARGQDPGPVVLENRVGGE